MNPKRVKLNRSDIDYGACLPIQLQGKKVCETCPHKDIKTGQEACPSPEIRKTGKNSLGVTVPVQKKS